MSFQRPHIVELCEQARLLELVFICGSFFLEARVTKLIRRLEMVPVHRLSNCSGLRTRRSEFGPVLSYRFGRWRVLSSVDYFLVWLCLRLEYIFHCAGAQTCCRRASKLLRNQFFEFKHVKIGIPLDFPVKHILV